MNMPNGFDNFKDIESNFDISAQFILMNEKTNNAHLTSLKNFLQEEEQQNDLPTMRNISAVDIDFD